MTAVAIVLAIIGGGVGAVLRWAMSLAFAMRSLPIAVLVVNVVASAIGGVVLGLSDAGVIDSGIRLILVSGIAGGLSTFSTWSVETIQLARDGRWRVAAAGVAANLTIGIGFGVLGYVAVAAMAA